MIEGAIYDEGGRVYIRYFQPAPKYVKIGNKEYVSGVQHAVSMFLADESDVPALLAHLGGCCGGQRKIFSLASQGAVNVFLTGDR
jgi:hypothetical protein